MKTFHCIESAESVMARSVGQAPSELPVGTYYYDNGKLCISYMQVDVPEILWPYLIYCCEQVEGGFEIRTPLAEGFTAAHQFAGWPVPVA